MLGSQLLQLIKSLSKKDMRELHKVVQSPYFNQREDVINLFNAIEKSLNSKLLDLSKEKIFKDLYPNKKYDDVLMRQMMSHLYKIIQKYLITEGVLGNVSKSQFHLIESLKSRNIEKLLDKTIEETIINHENQNYKNSNYHYIKFKLLAESYEYHISKKRTTDIDLKSLTEELDYFYFSERLRQACIIHAYQVVSKKNFLQPVVKSIIEQIQLLDKIPISVSAYYFTYLALTETENIYHFQNLKKIITESSYLFPENEQKDLYLFATNYCIKKLNNGEKKFGREALELYRIGLDNKILLENGILWHYVYKNINMLALKSEEYDWAEKFLYDFKQYLPEKERENIFQYNLALFYFRTGKYSEAMTLLQKVNLNDVLYNLDARRLLARIYFDVDEINALQSLIESSKVYLHRQKGIGYHHDMYTNYFRFLEKMMKIDMKKAEARAILRGEVEGTQLLAEREWLLQKLS